MITTATVYPISVKEAMRDWPTGVAVVTTADREGWWWACTVSSVASVSTKPPLVAISIPRDAPGRQTFTAADALAIHVLRADQGPLADHFTKHPTDFDDLHVECGFESVPLLTDVAVRLECRPVNALPAGTSVLLLAEVVRARKAPGDPLVHVGDHYRRLARPA
jgi:flavin reductase ActVB